jgi:hypothetical protein
VVTIGLARDISNLATGLMAAYAVVIFSA